MMWLAAVPFDCNVTKPTQPTAQLPDGLQYRDVVLGSGQAADTGMTVSVNYVIWLADGGTKVDASADHGGPFSFRLGAGVVIPGWDQGIPGMRVGGRRLLIIPPALGYGPQGYPGVIPPNARLVSDISLLLVAATGPESIALAQPATRRPPLR
jgi:peptidylprolyl isomerase